MSDYAIISCSKSLCEKDRDVDACLAYGYGLNETKQLTSFNP